MLKHHAETLARDLVRGQAGDVFALEDDIACRRAFDAHDRLHRGRLAGAVRADQTENLAGAHLEAQVLNGGEATEALDQAADFENGSVIGGVHHERASRDRAAPRKPPGKNRTTSSATAETMNVASSPVGRRNSQ